MSIQYYNLTTHQRDVVIDIQTSLAALKYKVDELQSSGSTISLSIPATQLTWSNPNTGDTLTIQQALELIKVQVSLLENTPLSATDISCINSNSQTSDLQTQLNSLYQHQTLKFHIMQSSIPTTIMYSITYGNHIFVAVGANGMIFRTLTVHVWRSRASNVLKRLTSVTYGNGMFVAVGDNGSITTSSSTVTWANHTINSTYNYTNIIYANGMFVIVGNSGRIVTSVDGKTWTEQTSTVSDDLSSIV
jgi:hypothetical protein